jgi:hypothetical protein
MVSWKRERNKLTYNTGCLFVGVVVFAPIHQGIGLFTVASIATRHHQGRYA